jgi:NitT/TauT family transport system substrate-binding protein
MVSKALGPVVLGAAAGAMALGVATATPAGAMSHGEMKEINIITSNSASCGNYPQFIGTELGIAADRGLTWNLMNSETTIPFVAFLDTKDAEFVMLDSAQVLQMANAKQPHSVVYEVYTFATEGIVVPADSPIKGLSQLKDVTIGLASDRDQITTIITMDSIGETVESMNIKTVVVGDSGPVMANALSSGQIDAFAGGSSDRGNIIAAGVPIRNITPPEVSANPANNWAMANARMEEGFAEPFLQSWAMSQHAGQIDTQAVQSICRKVVPEQWEVTEVGAKIVYDQVYTYQVPRGRLRGELRPWVWEGIQGPYIKTGEISEFIPAEVFLDDRFLEEANNYETYDVVKYINAWKEANPDALNW